MKRFIWILGIVTIIGLIGCKSKSSDEAKKLLEEGSQIESRLETKQKKGVMLREELKDLEDNLKRQKELLLNLKVEIESESEIYRGKKFALIRGIEEHEAEEKKYKKILNYIEKFTKNGKKISLSQVEKMIDTQASHSPWHWINEVYRKGLNLLKGKELKRV